MSASTNPRTVIRIGEVLRRTGLKRTMMYGQIQNGKFPKQVPLGARAVGWYEDEVDEWIRNRDSENRPLEQIVQVATHKEPSLPAPRPDREYVRPANSLKPNQSKLSASTGAMPTLDIDFDGDRAEAMSAAEELKRLRRENSQLKKLLGELVLKNSILKSSAELKATTN